MNIDKSWLAFLSTYRTMCLVPEGELQCVLEELRGMRVAA
jgi:hypothetical protein